MSSNTAIADAKRPSRSPPNREQERRLFVRWQRFGDERARGELVERFLPLARELARRFARGREGSEDLAQVASIGLLKAIDRFDPERGIAFTSFAVPTITGELKRHVRDYGWPLHVPRPVRERAVRVRRVADSMASELGRWPALAEVATACDLTTEEVLEAIEAEASARPASLELVGRAEEDPTSWLAVDDEGYELVDYRDAVARSLDSCSDRDRLVLRLRLVEDLPQREIGLRIGASQMQVSRILRQLLREAEAGGP